MPCLTQLGMTAWPEAARPAGFGFARIEPGVAARLQYVAEKDGPLQLTQLISSISSTNRALPLIDREILEQQRASGSAAIDPDEAVRSDAADDPVGRLDARFEACIDAKGTVTSTATSAEHAHGSRALIALASAAVKQWTFRPFLRDGQATPVCTRLEFLFPAGPTNDVATEREAAKIVPPNVLNAQRVSGATDIIPDDATKFHIAKSGKSKAIITAHVCVDRAGHVDSVDIVHHSGFAPYDAMVATKIKDWRYRPYTINGAAVKACTAVTFIYQQH